MVKDRKKQKEIQNVIYRNKNKYIVVVQVLVLATKGKKVTHKAAENSKNRKCSFLTFSFQKMYDLLESFFCKG